MSFSKQLLMIWVLTKVFPSNNFDALIVLSPTTVLIVNKTIIGELNLVSISLIM